MLLLGAGEGINTAEVNRFAAILTIKCGHILFPDPSARDLSQLTLIYFLHLCSSRMIFASQQAELHLTFILRRECDRGFGNGAGTIACRIRESRMLHFCNALQLLSPA